MSAQENSVTCGPEIGQLDSASLSDRNGTFALYSTQVVVEFVAFGACLPNASLTYDSHVTVHCHTTRPRARQVLLWPSADNAICFRVEKGISVGQNI